VIVGGLAAVTLVLLPRRPAPIPLSNQRRTVDAALDEVFQQLASFEPGPTILERRGNHLIVEFPIRVGWYRTTSVERVTLDRDGRRITFEQLRSPFFSIRTATEVFELFPQPGGATLVSLQGLLWPRLGFFGWLTTRQLVKPRWDAIDAKVLERLGQRIEPVGAGIERS